MGAALERERKEGHIVRQKANVEKTKPNKNDGQKEKEKELQGVREKMYRQGNRDRHIMEEAERVEKRFKERMKRMETIIEMAEKEERHTEKKEERKEGEEEQCLSLENENYM